MTSLGFNFVLAAALMFCVSCHSDSSALDAKTLKVFDGFNLVGQGAAEFESDGSLDVTYIVPHDDREKSPPDHLRPRVQYIFHSRSSLDPRQLGLTELPNRLRELGFQVLQGPNINGGQFSYPYVGGPYFSITFQDGDHKGVIFTRTDTKVMDKNWIVHDYVLVFLS